MKYLLITLFVHIGLFSFGQSTLEYNYQNYMILDKPLEGALNWEGAKDICESLTAFGYDNWELPSYDILYKVCREGKLSNDSYHFFWTSTTEGGLPVYLSKCIKTHGSNATYCLVYCVRKTK